MNPTSSLSEAVRKSMADIIDMNGLVVVEVSSSEVLLRANIYTLDICANRDGVSVVYFDKGSKPIVGYNLVLFLLQKRRAELTFSEVTVQPDSYGSFIAASLNAIAQHLRSAGTDILSGSKDWIADYSWPKVRPAEEVASLL